MTATHTHHPHDHAHPHEHSHSVESYDHVKGGPVVLDIGGDIGALVVTMPDMALGTEVHLRSVAEPHADVHTGVWSRGPAGQEQPTAVFMALHAGTYWVLDDTGDDLVAIEISGGTVEMLDLTN